MMETLKRFFGGIPMEHRAPAPDRGTKIAAEDARRNVASQSRYEETRRNLLQSARMLEKSVHKRS